MSEPMTREEAIYFLDDWRVMSEKIHDTPRLTRALDMAIAALRGPQFLCQEYTGKWHAFESQHDGEHFGRDNDHGYSRQTVSEWIWHPKAPQQEHEAHEH